MAWVVCRWHTTPRNVPIDSLNSSGHYMYRHVVPTQCIYAFCVDLRTNSDYFTIQHWLTGFYNRVFIARYGLYVHILTTITSCKISALILPPELLKLLSLGTLTKFVREHQFGSREHWTNCRRLQTMILWHIVPAGRSQLCFAVTDCNSQFWQTYHFVTTWCCAQIWLEQCPYCGASRCCCCWRRRKWPGRLSSPRTIVSTFPHTKYFTPACVTSVDFSGNVTLRKCLFCQLVTNEMTVNR